MNIYGKGQRIVFVGDRRSQRRWLQRICNSSRYNLSQIEGPSQVRQYNMYTS